MSKIMFDSLILELPRNICIDYTDQSII